MKDVFLYTPDVCMYKNQIWFAHLVLNKLFCVNIDDKCIEKVVDIPGTSTVKVTRTGLVKCFDEKIWIFPGTEKKIWVYDIRSNDFVASIDIDFSCSFAIDCGDYIFLLGLTVAKAYKIDKKTYTMSSCIDLEKKLDNFMYITDCRQISKSEIVAMHYDSRQLVKIDVENNKTNVFVLDALPEVCTEAHFVSTGENYYVYTNTENNKKLYKINQKTLMLEDAITVFGPDTYAYVHFFDNKILLDYGKNYGCDFYDEKMTLCSHFDYEKDEALKHFEELYPFGIWKTLENGLNILFNNYNNKIYFWKNDKVVDIISLSYEINSEEITLDLTSVVREDIDYQLQFFIQSIVE